MKKWTDNLIRKHIEELIEESYILSLAPEDLGKYLHDLIQASETILRRGPHLSGDVKVTRLKIALLRARLLENEIMAAVAREGSPGHAPDATLQEKTVRTKRIIMMLLKDIGSHVAEQVIREMKRRAEHEAGQSHRTERLKSVAVVAGYYGLLAMTLILLWIAISY